MTSDATVSIEADPGHLPRMVLPLDLDPHPFFARALHAIVAHDVHSYRSIIAEVPEGDRFRQGFALLEPIAELIAGRFDTALLATATFFRRFGVHPYLWLLSGLCHENRNRPDEAASGQSFESHILEIIENKIAGRSDA
ncbi:MAG: hypothetical protein FJX59_02980 [Alphaproteobacteria bacterium]|nr:hypothetical protein [Alphaproteobacteria bacterium]